MASYLKLRFKVRDHDVAALEDLLEDTGALAVSCAGHDDTPVFDAQDGSEPPLWPLCEVEGLFPADADTQVVLARCAAEGIVSTAVRCEPVGDQDWQHVWRDQFQPLCFGGELWVCPSWHRPPADAALVITLDPGMAFGTGTHPTTGLCLEWLVQRAAVADKRVLDFGCGSGILALAAARLGAQRIVAVDIDPAACEVARENAARNDCARLEIMRPDELGDARFDIIVANLLLKPILALRDTFAARLAPGGAIALSGLLGSQVDAVRAAYASVFDLTTTELRGEWALLGGRR